MADVQTVPGTAMDGAARRRPRPASPGGTFGGAPARAGRALVAAYGLIAYASFTVVIGYYVFFLADAGLTKTVDGGGRALGHGVATDLLLIAAFGLQHSLMARSAFKRWLVRVIPEPLERSTFVIASALTLFLLCALWRPEPAVIWRVRGGAGALVLHGLFWGGVLVAFGSTFIFSHTELFGLDQVRAYLRGQRSAPPVFRVPGPYRLVRHPMHLGMLMALWGAPLLTAGHLLFSLGMTTYVLVGIHFEERDLVRQFGSRYLAYRRDVPALLPIPRQLRARLAATGPGATAAG